jgi:hypothetical protein
MNPAIATPFPTDRMRALVIGNTAGALLLAAGTAATAHAASPGDQIAWLNLAAAGLVVGGVSNASFLRHARRTIRRQARSLGRCLP